MIKDEKNLVNLLCGYLERRPGLLEKSPPLRLGDLTLDCGSREVTLRSEEVNLTALKFDLISVMALGHHSARSNPRKRSNRFARQMTRIRKNQTATAPIIAAIMGAGFVRTPK